MTSTESDTPPDSNNQNAQESQSFWRKWGLELLAGIAIAVISTAIGESNIVSTWWTDLAGKRSCVYLSPYDEFVKVDLWRPRKNVVVHTLTPGGQYRIFFGAKDRHSAPEERVRPIALVNDDVIRFMPHVPDNKTVVLAVMVPGLLSPILPLDSVPDCGIEQ